MCRSMFHLFFSKKMFFMADSKGFVHYFYNHTKNVYNKFEFLEN